MFANVKSRTVDILLLQEPYQYQNKIVRLGSATTIYTGNDFNETPWAAIAIFNRSVRSMLLTQFSNSHCVCIEISFNGERMYLISMYCQSSHRIPPNLEHLKTILKALRGRKILISMDANAKSPMWFNSSTDNSGAEMEMFILEEKLYLLNEDGCPPTYASERGTSNIDITLATGSLVNVIKSWEVIEEWTTSDHDAIKVTISGKNTLPRKNYNIKGFNIKKANWELFQENLSRYKKDLSANSYNNETEVTGAARNIQKSILAACNNSIPRQTQSPKGSKWWTSDLENKKKKVNRSRKKFQKEKTETMKIHLKEVFYKHKAEYHIAIAKTKENSWERFTTNEGNKEPWGIIYKLQCEKIQMDQCQYTIRKGNEYAKTWSEAASYLLDGLIPTDNPHGETEEQYSIRRNILTPPETTDTSPFSEDELLQVFLKSKKSKAPGIDYINMEILQSSYGVIHQELLNMYNGCLHMGTFPKIWKIGKMVAILKDRTKDKADPWSYRPICLLPTLGKVLEGLMLGKLQKIISHERSSNNQYGFRKRRCTEDAIMKVKRMVKDAKEKLILGLFLDIRGAFDNVWWPSVLMELKHRECPRNLYILIEDYLRNRKIVAMRDRERIQRNVNKGCQQGSVLGPVFWNIIFDPLLNKLEELNIEITAYADDIVVIIKAMSRKEIEEKGNIAMKTIIEWCVQNKMQLSESKSVMMLLKGKLDMRRPPVIYINSNIRMKVTTQFKYLGVVLTKGIKFCIKETCDKATRLYGKLTRIAKKEYGLNYRSLISIYKGLFVPIVTYAAAPWYDEITTHQKRKLISAQRMALLGMTKAYKNVSNDALTVIAGTLPILLEIQKKAYAYFLRKNIKFDYDNIRYDGSEDITIKQRIWSKINEKILGRWQEHWELSMKGRDTFKYLPEVKVRINSYWIEPNHYTCQFITAHGNFKAKLYSYKLSEDSECLCGEPQTADHVLFECPILESLRGSLKEKLLSKTYDLNWKNLIRIETYSIFKENARKMLERLKELYT